VSAYGQAVQAIQRIGAGFSTFSSAMEQTVSYTLDSTLETVDHAEEKATRIAT
jgi:hypothetical protein